MGIPGILPEILGAAGLPVDLRAFSPGVAHTGTNQQSQQDALVPLRIGVDVSTWIHSASYGHNDRLNDERHLSNYGRAELLNDNKIKEAAQAIDNTLEKDAEKESSTTTVPPEFQKEYILTCVSNIIGRLQTLQQSTRAEILVVLDGNMAPVKAAQVGVRHRKRKQAELERDLPVDQTGDEEALERRFRMSKRAGAGKYFAAILVGVLDQLRINKIPFLVAPYEADAQLAYLSLQRWIDLIVTEDSDLLAYGSSPIVYKLIENISRGDPTGILIRREDMSAQKDSGKNSNFDIADFTPLMMTVMFVVVGSDYNIKTKLNGLGLIAANNIVRDAFFRPASDKGTTTSILEHIFNKAFLTCWDRLSLTEEFKEAYKKEFIEALLMFRHPVVFDPIRGCCITMGNEDGDPELMSYEPYAELFVNQSRRGNVVGAPYEKDVAMCIAEGWISPKTLRPYEGSESSIPEHVTELLAAMDSENELTASAEES